MKYKDFTNPGTRAWVKAAFAGGLSSRTICHIIQLGELTGIDLDEIRWRFSEVEEKVNDIIRSPE